LAIGMKEISFFSQDPLIQIKNISFMHLHPFKVVSLKTNQILYDDLPSKVYIQGTQFSLFSGIKVVLWNLKVEKCDEDDFMAEIET